MNNTVRYFDWDPRNLPRELLEAIGLAITSSAQTESIIEDAIAGCLGVNFEYGKALTVHMAMPLRFSTLRSVAEIRIDNLDYLDDLDEILDQIDTAFIKRNAIAHNRWCRDPKTGELFTLKETARTRLEADLLRMSINQVKRDALFVYEVGMDLFSFLKLTGLLPIMPDALPPRGHKSKAARKKRREQKR